MNKSRSLSLFPLFRIGFLSPKIISLYFITSNPVHLLGISAFLGIKLYLYFARYFCMQNRFRYKMVIRDVGKSIRYIFIRLIHRINNTVQVDLSRDHSPQIHAIVKSNLKCHNPFNGSIV